MTTIEVRRERRADLLPALRAHVAHRLDDVLIVGAGHGDGRGDRPAEGAGHVDAVEIDPRLQQIGAERHPDHPYDDPRVSVHIDDGRAFLERTDSKYDLILFALPDSLTLVSGQSVAAARELPVHAGGDGGGPRPPQARRRLRHVQLLPRGVADRPPRRDARRRRTAMRRASTRSAAWDGWPCSRVGLAEDAVDVPDRVDADRRRGGRNAGDRRLPVPLPPGASDSRLLPADAGPDPRRIAGASRGGLRAALAGCARTSTSSSWAPRSCCSRRRASSSSRCCSARPGSSTRSCSPACCSPSSPRSRSRGACGSARPQLLYVALLASLAVAWLIPPDALLQLDVAPRFVGRGARVVHADLHREPRLRAAVPRRRGVERGVRGEPARARWSAGCSSTRRSSPATRR